MPVIASVKFTPTTPYIPDRAATAATATNIYGSARFRLPRKNGTGLSDGAIQTIATAAGFSVYKIGDNIVDDTLASPCPSDGIDWRKLIFTMDGGITMSVPISNRANLITARNEITDILNTGTFNVLCVKLDGESFKSLNKEFGVNTTDTLATEPEPPTTGAGSNFAGSILYQGDNGSTNVTPVKILSDQRNAGAPTALTNSWESCVGDFIRSRGCTSSKSRHRRYIADFQVAGFALRNREIPVKNRAAADIQSCGEAIVTELAGALVCLRYRGESDSLFHLAATPAPPATP